jgi:hypothetical protein
MWTKRFLVDALERAVKTAAQSAAAAITGGQIGLFDARWKSIGGMAAIAFIYSILTSIASNPVGETGSASLLPDK